ncbi:MAG: gliding motility-associated C-terminal domain-containing protein [Bacteroidota bacterium]
MENRLPKIQLWLLMLSFFLGAHQYAKAQLDFTFVYTGPDTIFVGADCTAPLDWMSDSTVMVTCNTMNCSITTFMLNNISGGYSELDPVPAGNVVTITYFVQDNFNNVGFFGFNVTFVDSIAPTFDSGLPPDGTFDCLTDVPAPPTIGSIMASDNCPSPGGTNAGVTVVYNGETTPPTTCAGGDFTRSWTVTDSIGNATTYVQTITINADTSPPTITGVPTDLTEDCATADYTTWLTNQRATFMATDGGCGVANLDDDAPAALSSTCESVMVTFTAMDNCGLSSTTVATYTVEDNADPVITPPMSTNITLECVGPVDPITLIDTWSDSLTVTDNCNMITWSNDFMGLTGGCGGLTGLATVTYTASDGCGNASSVTLNFTVNDTNDPNIIVGAIDTMVVCDGTGNNANLFDWLDNRAGARASDVCTDDATIVETLLLGTTNVGYQDIQDSLNVLLANGCGASITVRFAFTDACGNTSTTDAEFVITDNVDPVWDVDPTDLTVECDGTTDPNGEITTWLANNGNGSASDVCRLVGITNNYTPIVFSCGAVGSTTVTFTATDACGNSVDRMANVTIVDTTAPTWDANPGDVTVECDGAGNAAAFAAWVSNAGGGSASDLCGTVMITNDNPMLSDLCGATGTVTATFTATDECGGNTANRMATFTIEDTTPPTWDANPSSLTLECDGTNDPGGAIAAWLTANGGTGMASDVCGSVIITNDYAMIPDPCGGSATISVTFTATDDCGNASDRVVSLTITDTTNPIWTTNPMPLVVECDGTNDPGGQITNWLANAGGGVADDICSANIVYSNDYAGLSDLCGATGMAMVTFTAQDECGNPVTFTTSVTVEDNTDPSIDTPAMDAEVECDNPAISFADWSNSQGGAIATDLCSPIGAADWSTNLLTLVSGCGGTFEQPVEFTVTDDCGNAATTTATYRVVDNISPQIIPTATSITEACGGGNDQMNLNAWIDNFGGASANDCSGVNWTDFDYVTSAGVIGNSIAFGNTIDYPAIVAGDCTWSVEVTLRVSDNCGNVSTTMASFTIEDTEDPVFDPIPGPLTVECDMVPAPILPTATDNCDLAVDISLSADTMFTACPNNYTITRTWTATDDCNNSVSTARVITVQDTTDPVLSGVPGNITVECDMVPAPATPTATDNCMGIVTIALDADTMFTACPNNFTITRTWTATDACGNDVAASQTIVVEDTQAPTFTGPADITVSCEQGIDPAVTGSPTNILDNCDDNPVVASSDNITVGSCPNNSTVTRTWLATDACGNVSIAFVQTITVVDNTAPSIDVTASDETFTCTDMASADAAFAAWIANNGGAMASDNCSSGMGLNWDAWVPGSYNIMDPLTFPGTSAGGLDPVSCPTATMGVYQSETVDFVVFDECGNVSVTSATFEVIDNTPPVFESCGVDITLPNTPGVCEANFLLPAPIISEACSNTSSPVTSTVTQPITSVLPGNESVPVNPVVLTFSSLPSSPVLATDPVTIDIEVSGVDAEEPTEFFNIVGEEGFDLGQTPNTTTQCGTVMIQVTVPATVFNSWVLDGMVTITLEPNLPADPIFAINDICPAGAGTGGGGTVAATLNYNTTAPTGLVFEYSINGGARNLVAPVMAINEVFPVGDNMVTYYARDCAGNETTCSFTITVEDVEQPVINCPSDIVMSLGPDDDCDDGLEITLPIPTFIDDNCSFPLFSQTQPFNQAESFITFSYNPNYLEYIADDKSFTFVGLSANATGANVTFTVNITGDHDDPEEFFTILGDDGSVIGTTEVGQPNVTIIDPGNCAGVPPSAPVIEAVLSVTTTTYNAWAADGTVNISAVANQTFASPPPATSMGDGMNPVCTSFANGTPNGQSDNRSRITIRLDLPKVTPYYFTSGATVIPPTTMMAPAIAPTRNFDIGVTEVFYVVNDLNGNADSCMFTVTVQDNIAPEVGCEPTTIFVNPSGIDPYILEVFEIDNGISDNCAIDTQFVTPNTFDCTLIGSTINVDLTVTDESGNSTVCSTIVKVEAEEPEPAFSIGLCGNDTLSLFANPPFAQGGIIYTYTWSGPNGFISTEQNPIIPNADADNSGSYVVEVEGLTSCTAIGTVEVVINDTPNVPVISTNSDQLCTNEDLVLTTQNYSGNSVTYSWFAGIFPGGTFIANTSFPTFTLPAPLGVGTNTYFVIVEVDGCVSDASFFTSVTVSEAPVASTNTPLIEVCEGELISLGTSVSGTGLTYQWTGPNGFSSTAQNPAAIAATAVDAGNYSLVIISNGCPSDAATTTVNVTDKPTTPILSISNGLVCDGESVTLTTNIFDADLYTWVAPDFSTQVTTTPSLTLTDLTAADAGDYTLFVSTSGCDSDMSLAVTLFVESAAAVQAVNNGPTCEGGTVQLSATAIPGATYAWTGPNGYSSLDQIATAPAVPGTYTVIVTTSAGCSNSASTDVAVTTEPGITAISNTGAACVTGADDIFLAATVFPPDDGSYTYLWIGPNGFSSVDVMPTLPNGTSIDNGSYTLVVTNGAGCASPAMTTVVNVSDAPITPTISGNGGLCEGEVLTLTTDGYVGTSVEYTWSTPNGTQTTSIPSLTIFPVTDGDTGDYSVEVMVDGCPSNQSAVIQVTVTPVPSTPTVSAASPVCAGSTIELTTMMIPDATYEWTGPAGFTSDVFNPVIFNATEDNEGTYSVRILINGCASSFSVPVNVVVNDAPDAPTIVSEGAVCIDEANASTTLSIVPATATAGASYTWFNAQTNEPLFGPSTSLNFILDDFTGFGDGTFDFYVIATLDGCSSIISVPTSVTMNTVPSDLAFAGEDISVCGGQSVTLNASAPTIGTGQWTQTSGPTLTISNPSSANTIISGLTDGADYTFLWTLSNGACGAYSSDEIAISVNQIGMQADAGLNISICNDNSTTLNATAAGIGTSGVWTQPASQSAAGVVIADPTDPNTQITGLDNPNEYTFTWTLSNPGCGNFSTDEVEVSVEVNNEVAFAGIDISECGVDVVQLNATVPSGGVGTWSTTVDGVTIVSPNSPNTVVQGLGTGDASFIWTLDNGACGSSSDEVIVTLEAAPIANADAVTVPFNGSQSFDVTANDEYFGSVELVRNSTPSNGTVEDLGNGNYLYTANTGYVGTDEFSYTVCSEFCPDICATATVSLTVGEDASCDIPTIITPNDDGVNDFFVIPCLGGNNFTGNTVSIFNEWGDEVFRSVNYTNNWNGLYNGEQLPVGTYYFVVDFGNGQTPQAGFVVLER